MWLFESELLDVRPFAQLPFWNDPAAILLFHSGKANAKLHWAPRFCFRPPTSRAR
jgi:hypothetical protein